MPPSGAGMPGPWPILLKPDKQKCVKKRNGLKLRTRRNVKLKKRGRENKEMAKQKAEERAKKAAERRSRLTKRAAPKATSASKNCKVDKDSTPSSLEPGVSVLQGKKRT